MDDSISTFLKIVKPLQFVYLFSNTHSLDDFRNSSTADIYSELFKLTDEDLVGRLETYAKQLGIA